MTTEQLKRDPDLLQRLRKFANLVQLHDACKTKGRRIEMLRSAADHIEQLEAKLSSQTAVKTEQPSLSVERDLLQLALGEVTHYHGCPQDAIPPTGECACFGGQLASRIRTYLSAQRRDSDKDAAIGEQCVSSSGPIGCYRVRCHLGGVCVANRAPK